MDNNSIIKKKCWKNFILTAMFIALHLSVSNSLHAGGKSEILSMNKLLQQNRITLNLRNKPIKTILYEIQKQSKINFVVKDEGNTTELSDLSINVSNVTVADALTILLKNTSYTYRNDGDVITIIKRPKVEKKITVRGVVLERESKEPITGATILVSGTTTGAVSGPKGEFVINNVSEDAKLEISFTGMKSETSDIKHGINLVIELEQDALAVEDVVVTGLFNANRSTYTGAATSITRKDIQNISITNIFTVINSLDPSFRVTENNAMGSNPNMLPEFTIRGSGSITNALKDQFEGDPNCPLFMVDGFEMSLEKVFDIDPLRVESITILKDAAATAVYGSQAANGIVVIELIKPVRGKLRVDYSGKIVVAAPDLSSYDLLNARQKFEVEAAAGIIQPMTDRYNQRLSNVVQGFDTYWLNKPLAVGTNSSHLFKISGGDNHLQYSIDLSYNPNKGVMKGSDRERYSTGASMAYVNGKFRFSYNIDYDYTGSDNSPYGDFSQYARLNPYYEIYDKNGEYLYQFENSVYNPLWNSTLNYKNSDNYTLFTNRFTATWNVTKNLMLSASGSISQRKGTKEKYLSSLHTDFQSSTDFTQRGSYEITNAETLSKQGTLKVAYYKQVNKHNITSNLGLSYTDSDALSNGFSVLGLPDPELTDPSNAVGYHPSRKPSGASQKSRSMGAYANINYSYDNTYYADFSFRADISSKFGKDSRWAPFWSVGVGYNLHNEEFMKSIHWINQIKFRGSIGVTGSQNYDPYQSMTKYKIVTNEFYGSSVASVMMGLGNPNLKWQQVYKTNIGMDLGFLQNRLGVSFNYYSSKSKRLLVPFTLAPSLGFNSYMENLGEALNRGIEGSFRFTVVKKKDLSINVTANGAYNQNTLTKISNSLASWNSDEDRKSTNGSSLPKVRYIEGASMNTLWVVRSMGIDPANGREMYLDRDGNITYVWNPDDQVAFATTDPKLNGAIGINVSWRELTLNVSGSYSLGAMKYNETIVSRVENANLSENCDVRVYSERWRKPGDKAYFKDIADPTGTSPTSRFVQHDDSFKITSITLGYQFSQKALNKIGFLKSLRLAFSTNDLLNISTIKMERGTNYPFARSFNFSLSTSL